MPDSLDVLIEEVNRREKKEKHDSQASAANARAYYENIKRMSDEEFAEYIRRKMAEA